MFENLMLVLKVLVKDYCNTIFVNDIIYYK